MGSICKREPAVPKKEAWQQSGEEKPVETSVPHDRAARPVDVQAGPCKPTLQDILDLRGAIQRRVEAERDRAKETDDLVEDFVSTIFAILAGRLFAKLFHAVCVHARLPTDRPKLHLLAHVIYAVLWTAALPLAAWCAGKRAAKPAGERAHPPSATDPVREPSKWEAILAGTKAFLAQQRDLAMICLPMIFAWAWNDVVDVASSGDTIRAVIGRDTAMDMIGGRVKLSLALLLAVALTLLAILLRLSAPFLSTKAAIFDDIGLVVGYAWNGVLRTVWGWAAWRIVQALGFQGSAPPPFVTFAVSTLYFVVVRAAVVSALSALPSPCKATQVVLDKTLRFVSAWAQLNCLNMFFFNYLQGCSTHDECGHANNFYFAMIVSIVSVFLTKELQHAELKSIWGEALVKNLLIGALSLNTGDAWSNFCDTAIKDAVEHDGLERLRSYILCTLFVWACMSYLHGLLGKVISARGVHYREAAYEPLVWLPRPSAGDSAV